MGGKMGVNMTLGPELWWKGKLYGEPFPRLCRDKVPNVIYHGWGVSCAIYLWHSNNHSLLR